MVRSSNCSGLAVVGGRGAAQHRAHPRDQLARAEGLGDIVVGAAVEAAQLVAFLAARGQHDDGHAARFRHAPQLPADLDAGEQRQHPVEQHQVRLLLARQQQRLLAVARFGHAEAFALEVVAQQRHQRRLVLDHEDQSETSPSSPPLFAAHDAAGVIGLEDGEAGVVALRPLLRRCRDHGRGNGRSRRCWWRGRRCARCSWR